VVYGRRLQLNRFAIVVAVMSGGLVWGVAGAFLAVPILAAVKTVCRRMESMRAVAVFLEG
jgi:predicted PurR-regulated permease PerM